MNKGYKKLKVFQEANQLVKMIYQITENYPKVGALLGGLIKSLT